MNSRNIAITLILVATGCAAQVGSDVDATGEALTYSNVDEDNRFPYVGALAATVPTPDGDLLFPGCSLVLIDATRAITAAHCIELMQAEIDAGYYPRMTVSFELQLGTTGLRKYEIDHVVVNPAYYEPVREDDPADIAVIHLAEEVVGIEPAILAQPQHLDWLYLKQEIQNKVNKWKKKDERVETRFTLVGYGGLVYEGELVLPDNRRTTEAPLKALERSILVTNSVNEETGGGGVCLFDSGGPVIWTDRKGRDVVMGIAHSADPQCAVESLYYRLDTPSARKFIRRN